MIFCGIDLVENERIERLLKTYGERFLNKIFPEGVPVCRERKSEVECLAARFALKEAAIKALGQAGKRVSFREIKITGAGKNLTLLLPVDELHVCFSITHEKRFSAAVVILQKNLKS